MHVKGMRERKKPEASLINEYLSEWGDFNTAFQEVLLHVFLSNSFYIEPEFLLYRELL